MIKKFMEQKSASSAFEFNMNSIVCESFAYSEYPAECNYILKTWIFFFIESKVSKEALANIAISELSATKCSDGFFPSKKTRLRLTWLHT